MRLASFKDCVPLCLTELTRIQDNSPPVFTLARPEFLGLLKMALNKAAGRLQTRRTRLLRRAVKRAIENEVEGHFSVP